MRVGSRANPRRARDYKYDDSHFYALALVDMPQQGMGPSVNLTPERPSQGMGSPVVVSPPTESKGGELDVSASLPSCQVTGATSPGGAAVTLPIELAKQLYAAVRAAGIRVDFNQQGVYFDLRVVWGPSDRAPGNKASGRRRQWPK